MEEMLDLVFYNIKGQYITISVNIPAEAPDSDEVDRLMDMFIDSEIFSSKVFRGAGEGEITKVRAELATYKKEKIKAETILEV